MALFSRRWIWTTLLVIAASVACVRLGIWQLQRLDQRRSFNAHVKSMTSLPALELPADRDLEDQEYREATAAGSYDFDHQVAVRNQAYEGRYGFHLLTPLRFAKDLGGRGASPSAILVDRGWIPAEGNEVSEAWRRYDEAGLITAHGVIRLAQGNPIFGGLAQPTAIPGAAWTEFWMYMDIAQIARQLPYDVLPVYLQLSPRGDSNALPVAAVPDLGLSEGPHKGYALQWFAFATILAIGFPVYVSKREKV